MNAISIDMLLSGVVRVWAAMAVAAWDAVAASPKLQMLVGACALLMLMRGAVNGLARRARLR